jgi:hypothetical protein
MSLIAFTGSAGSGKDTAAGFLIAEKGYEKLSFAGTLKDALAAIFGWQRDMLEGSTLASREWREQPDEWWSSALGRIITPRKMLQEWGTDVGRNAFHSDIWILSAQRQILQNPNKKYVITDCRFENEARALKALGGKLIGIRRCNATKISLHASEAGLAEKWLDDVIDNNGDLINFKEKVLNSVRINLMNF